MDRLVRLLRFEGRIAWRSFQARPLGRDELVLALGLLLVALFQFQTFLVRVAFRLRMGDPRPAEALLAGMLLAWVGWWFYSRGPEILKQLPALPLGRRDQFALRLLAGLGSMVPVGLIVLSGMTLAAIRGPSPGIGAWVANICYLCCCVAVGCAASHYREVLAQRRGIALAGFLLGGLLLVLGFFLLLQSRWAPQRLFIAWTTGGRPWSAAFFFAIAALLLFGLALAWAGASSRAEASTKKVFLFSLTCDWLPRFVPVLLLKDLRLISRHLETWILLGFSIQATLYFCFELNPHPLALSGLALVALSVFGPVTFNSFGLESRQALLRYRLLPLDGLDMLASKNHAFFLMTGFSLVPSLVSTAFRVGLVPPLTALMSACMMAILFVAFGNETSLRYPNRCRPFRFTSYRAESGLLRAVAVQILCTLPGALILLLALKHWWLVLGFATGGSISLVLVYKRWIQRQGQLLEHRLATGEAFLGLTRTHNGT